ncbi:hypothetical protein D9C73_023984 [Collichthys lucidus]|uniref:Uncharacterized protein n=1 Tax=Collichthys lucidus TaxID=240159 RepID=A0A4U5VRH5_COLLU|nr:hypothetical protein D9C73_023984 [Collichthys lucidus]
MAATHLMLKPRQEQEDDADDDGIPPAAWQADAEQQLKEDQEGDTELIPSNKDIGDICPSYSFEDLDSSLAKTETDNKLSNHVDPVTAAFKKDPEMKVEPTSDEDATHTTNYFYDDAGTSATSSQRLKQEHPQASVGLYNEPVFSLDQNGIEEPLSQRFNNTNNAGAEKQVTTQTNTKAGSSSSRALQRNVRKHYCCSLCDALGEFSSEPANPFVMPNFNTAEAGYPAASLNAQGSTLPSYLAPGVGAGPGLSSNPMLQAPTVSSKSASKRSPKLWPKRNANVVPINTPAPPLGEWSGVCFSTREEFSKLHEDFGKEVKELIADWSKRGRGDEVVQEENLIDFG